MMKLLNHFVVVCSLLLSMVSGWLLTTPPALASESVSKAPNGAEVYLIYPKDGDTVTAPFTAQFGLSGMGIAPAGVEREGTGHHHLLIDVDALPNLKEPLPATEHIKHFGGGQTEANLTLPPGQHTLRLVFANYTHIPHEPPVVSEPVTITVR